MGAPHLSRDLDLCDGLALPHSAEEILERLGPCISIAQETEVLPHHLMAFPEISSLVVGMVLLEHDVTIKDLLEVPKGGQERGI